MMIASSSLHPIVPSVVVGCGAWGENLVRTLKNLNALKGIVDHNEEHTSLMSQKYEVPTLSFSDALQDPAVEAIFIATRPDSHFNLGQQALLHKKNVFIEKPITTSAQETKELFKLSTQQQKILMTGHLLLYHPCYQHLQKEIRQGRIGEIQCITTRRQNFGKFFENDDILWDLGPHDLSIILGILPPQAPKKISSLHGQFLEKGDIFSGLIAFEAGPKVSLFLSRVSPVKEQNLTVLGSKGILVFEDTLPWEKKLQLVPFKEDSTWPPVKLEPTYLEVSQDEPLKQECLAFFQAIQTKTPPQNAESIIELISILEKLNAASF